MLIAASAQTNAACVGMIASGNPEYPPFLWQNPDNDKQLIGANAEYMQMLSREIGIPIEIRYVGPWSRVQEAARHGRIDLVAGAFLTQPRLAYMRYFQPAMRDTRSLIWMREGKTFTYQNWEDLAGKDGITVVNNSFGQAFDQFASSNLKLQQVGSVKNALQMLSLGRADYLIYEDSPGLAYAASLNIRNLRTASTSVSNENLHLTLSLDSPCNTGVMAERIQRANKKLHEEKVMDALIEKYILVWRQQQLASAGRPR